VELYETKTPVCPPSCGQISSANCHQHSFLLIIISLTYAAWRFR
jgi:hypothetical protein